MADRAYGTVMKAGMASMSYGHGARKGPSQKNVMATRKAKPNPAMAIKSMAGKAIKGSDRGAG